MEADTAAPALTVRGISKTYRLWATPASRLWVPLLYRMAGLVPLASLSGWLRRRAQARVHAGPVVSERADGTCAGDDDAPWRSVHPAMPPLTEITWRVM